MERNASRSRAGLCGRLLVALLVKRVIEEAEARSARGYPLSAPQPLA
ncbi:MAG: hypothetical protein HRF50_03020 [Phycisphaerae bacterium]|jgi:hypothetical protein